MSDDASLAIVVPAYKGRFLAEALASIAAQTDRRFRVYVGDDASSDDIGGICARYAADIDLVCHRFDENLGGRDLVAQWERCIGLSAEPWVWLFCDDDRMDPECVSSFYRHLSATDGQFDLFRFATARIDITGQVTSVAPEPPSVETALEFVCAKLDFQRDSFLSEYIFSRRVHDRTGGLVNFPLAWCADDATWIRFSAEKGIVTIPGARVYWRESDSNISLGGAIYHEDKLHALTAYIDWLNRQFATTLKTDRALAQRLGHLQRRWFMAHLGLLSPFGLKRYQNPPAFPGVLGKPSPLSRALVLLGFDCHHVLNNVKRWLRGVRSSKAPLS